MVVTYMMHTLHRWTVATGCCASWGSTVWSTACLGWSTTTETTFSGWLPTPRAPQQVASFEESFLRKPVKPNLQVSPLKVRIQLLCKQSFEAQNKRQSWYFLCDSGLESLWESDRIRVGRVSSEGHIGSVTKAEVCPSSGEISVNGLNRHLECFKNKFDFLARNWRLPLMFFTTSRYYISIHTNANNLSLYLYFCCFCILYLKWDPSGGDAIGGPPSRGSAAPIPRLSSTIPRLCLSPISLQSLSNSSSMS